MDKSLASCFLTHSVDSTVHDGTMFVNHTAFFLHKIPVLKLPAASHNGNSHSECDLKLLKIIRNLSRGYSNKVTPPGLKIATI